MEIIWTIFIFALTNINVEASNAVTCNTYDMPDEDSDLIYNRRYNTYERPPPLYVYGICHSEKFSRGDTLKFSNTNLKYILFKSSFIKTIPSRFFQAYSSLEGIFINDSYINEIDVNAFSDLNNLKLLYLQKNNLTDIGKGIYNNLQNLQILDISSNQIKIIEGKALHGLTHLKNLNLSYNKIQNISLDIFDSDLHSLDTLDLSHNFLLEIDLKIISNLFSANSVTSQINLSYNAIKFLNFSQLTCNINKLNLSNNNVKNLIDFQNSRTVNELDLSNNNISEFNFAPENIKYLNLSGNILSNLNFSILSDKIEIKTLDVSQNLIKNLSHDTFCNMSTLTYLNLANNKLAELPIGVFKNVNLLTFLNLSGNELEQFEFGTFSGLANLTELDISNNSFHSLDSKTFYILKNLIKLNIADNKLTTLNPYNILDHCKNLKVIMLNNNPWLCNSLLNLSLVLKTHQVKIPDGQSLNIRNHLGHPCYESEISLVTENSAIKYSSFQNEVYKPYPKLESLNDYFNKDFKNTEFYKYFNRNFSNNYYERSLRNFTETLNFINAKFGERENNIEKLEQVASQFSNFFDEGFKKSNFYEYFDKNFTDLIKNLKMTDSFNQDFQNSFYKFFLSKTTDSKFDEDFFNEALPTEMQLKSSNISFAKLKGDVSEYKGSEQQIESLCNLFIVFMSILTLFLFIITFLLFLLIKKFIINRGKQTITSSESAEFQLV